MLRIKTVIMGIALLHLKWRPQDSLGVNLPLENYLLLLLWPLQLYVLQTVYFTCSFDSSLHYLFSNYFWFCFFFVLSLKLTFNGCLNRAVFFSTACFEVCLLTVFFLSFFCSTVRMWRWFLVFLSPCGRHPLFPSLRKWLKCELYVWFPCLIHLQWPSAAGLSFSPIHSLRHSAYVKGQTLRLICHVVYEQKSGGFLWSYMVRPYYKGLNVGSEIWV